MLLFALAANGQSKHELRRSRIDSILTARYYKSGYDSSFVIRPEGKLTLKARVNFSGNTFHAKGTLHDISTKGDFHTDYKTTVSIAAAYRGITAAIAVNPAKIGGFYKDYELNLNYFSARYNVDASYQRSTSLSGDIDHDQTYTMEPGDVKLTEFKLTGYYVFNHRRFSYPAAFTQSYIQKRSAGSWLVGFSYQAGVLKTTDELKARTDKVPETRVYMGHFGIGGGYGYNWVLGGRWLLHLSILPTYVIYNRNNLEVDGEKKWAGHMRFNMIFNERVAIVRNFSERYFAGATLTMNNSLFDADVVTVNQNKWRARAFVGVRL